MNIGSLSVLIASLLMYDDSNDRTSHLGALLIASTVSALAVKGIN